MTRRTLFQALAGAFFQKKKKMPTVATFMGAYPPPDGYDFGHNGCNGQNGFEYNGKQYAVLQNGSNNLVVPYNYHLFENMTEVDAAHAPQASAPNNLTGNGEQSWTVAHDGSKVLLIETTTDGTVGAEGPEQTLNLYTLDVAGSRMWVGPTAFSVPVRSQYRNASSTSGTGQKQYCVKLAVRGPNDYILMFSGHPDTTGGKFFSRLYYATFNGTVFGTPVLLPAQIGGGPFFGGTPYYLGAGSIAVDSTGRCYMWAIDNASNSGQGPNLVLWTLTAGNSLSAAQIVDAGVYWADTQGTISNAITYTPTGGSETVAIAGEFEDISSNVTQRLYTAPIGDTPTFAESDVIAGVDTWSGSDFSYATNDDLQIPQFSEWNTQTIALAHDAVANQLMVVWAVTRLDNTITGGNPQGHFWARTSPDNALSWSASTLLFDSPPDLHNSSNSANKSAASQIWAYSTTAGMAVIGVSENQSAQFWTNASAPTTGRFTFAYTGKGSPYVRNRGTLSRSVRN